MKARQIFLSLLIILISALMFLSGCGSSSGSGSDAPSSAKAITAYSLNGVAGTIDETGKTIAVTMPSLTNVTALVAAFTTTGVSVTGPTLGSGLNGTSPTLQVSGVTVNNFSFPVEYYVTAADGSTVTYTITVTAGAWYNPASLSDNISPDGGSSSLVAMDNNGNAIIIAGNGYSEYRNGVWNYTNSPFWSSAAVAMDNNGNAIIIWTQRDIDDTWQISKSEYRNGVWTHPSSIADHFSPNGGSDTQPLYPRVAMDDNGNAIIVWQQYDGATFSVFKSEYRNGSWKHPASLSDHISQGWHAYQPNVAMDNNGNAIIVWKQWDGANYQIFKSEYRNGSWTYPANLSDNISPDGTAVWDATPQVAMDNNGNAIIVWDQQDGTTYTQIFKSEYRNGSWTNPSSLSDNISPDWYSAENPQVAMDDNGNAIIVWDQWDTNYKIFKSEYRGGAWHHPSSISYYINPSGTDAANPRVAMDHKDNAIIVWSQSDGTNSQIFKSEYRNGAWINPANLSDNISPNGTNAGIPQVAMDNNGKAIIVWSQSDGANYQIFKSEYR
jgi:hypothetical protein